MPPQVGLTPTGVLYETDEPVIDPIKIVVSDGVVKKPKLEFAWAITAYIIGVHIGSLIGLYLLLTGAPKFASVIFAIFLFICAMLGLTAGVHRLWSHRAYKANLSLRIILIIFNSIANEYDVITWASEHRIHHKYSDSDADPYNATRGAFFSHIGWVISAYHPEVILKKEQIDVSDLEQDPVLIFQRKYYYFLMAPLCCLIIPLVIPMYVWNETFINSLFVCVALRYVCSLNSNMIANSLGHMHGNRAYDKSIAPADNSIVNFCTLGDGWHNFHHTFPWDYRGADPTQYLPSLTTLFIDFFVKIGWASNRKIVSLETIKKRVLRTGDGSHPVWGKRNKTHDIRLGHK